MQKKRIKKKYTIDTNTVHSSDIYSSNGSDDTFKNLDKDKNGVLDNEESGRWFEDRTNVLKLAEDDRRTLLQSNRELRRTLEDAPNGHKIE